MEIPQKGPLQFLPARKRPAQLSVQSSSRRDNLPRRQVERDSVRLTESGRTTKNAVQQAHLLPDIREDRVARLRRQIEEGTYRVKGDRIAANMIDETLENNNVLKQIDTNA